MATKRKEYDFGDVIEREEYHDGKYGAPGKKREKKREATPEDIARVNQWQKTKKARHRILKYFGKNDYFVTITYRRDARPPDMETAKKQFRKLVEFIRTKYRKQEVELRWIRNIERGPKGAWHIHMILNRIPDTDIILQEAWKLGKIHIQLLYESKSFQKLAEYITKTNEKGESSYSTSRNMPLPEPEVKKLKRFPREAKPKKGYYIEKETYYEGINPVTGYRYRHYTLIKIDRRC